jgi:hypothetical protein
MDAISKAFILDDVMGVIFLALAGLAYLSIIRSDAKKRNQKH